MFFDDHTATKRQTRLKEFPPIPVTNWEAPRQFPNLSGAVALSIDTENKEYDWSQSGPGWGVGKSHICGFSVGAVDRQGAIGKWYFPLRHEVEPETNLDPAQCLAWLKPQLETPLIPKVGANLIYDVGCLHSAGINVQGRLHDVQFAAALLDERGEVNLEYLSQRYLNEGKVTDQLYDWSYRCYGGKRDDQRGNIYRCPPRLVGPYGEIDAANPLRILPFQIAEMDRQGLLPVYDMECNSIPIYIQMRVAGITVDLNKAEQLYEELTDTIAELYAKFNHKYGTECDSMKASSLVKVFEHCGVWFPSTTASNGKVTGNFEKEWLKELEHELGDDVNEIRELEKVQNTFLKKYILERNVNGKVHCHYHPLHSEDGRTGKKKGALTGRLSSSDPNLQNIPVRSKAGKRIRSIFTKDYGHRKFKKIDHSQIEYRMLAHYAVGPGSDELRARYIADPHTDYHNFVMIANAAIRHIDLSLKNKEELADFRRPIKNINFGLIYGQSEKSLAYKAGMSKEETAIFFPAYFQSAPYIKPTMKAIRKEVQQLGYITTIMGRRTRFDEWQPSGFEHKGRPLPYHLAIREYGAGIQRAYDYRGTNYRFQGSAADVLKAGMLAAHNSGVFNVVGYPRLQVHDELDFSVFDDGTPIYREAWEHLTYCLEKSVPCRVPLVVDIKTDDLSWGAIN